MSRPLQGLELYAGGASSHSVDAALTSCVSGGTVKMFRIVALVVIGLAAIVVALLPASRSADHNADVVAALAAADANNSMAEGAPQQQVVNGWVARDLLAILSAQLDEQNAASDRKVPLLLMLGVLALVVIGCTTPGLSGERSRTVSPAAESPTADPQDAPRPVAAQEPTAGPATGPAT